MTNINTGSVVDLATGLATPAQGDHRHGPNDHHEHGHHHHDHGHSHDAHDHSHDGHDHGHQHDHLHGDHNHGNIVSLQQSILAKNDSLAERNRAWLAGREVLMLNLVSSPGSGKTSLLERTIRDLGSEIGITVIEGDQATLNDGARIAAAGAPSIQVNTGTGCHLEADMIDQALRELKPRPGTVVFVENVGNLVCPSLFDLGERAKVAILSVTEGEDKPLKYPHMFKAAELVIVNKIDLLPHLDLDIDELVASARAVNPNVVIIQLSAKTGEGLAEWYDWLRQHLAEAQE
ncbi:MAG: hydrogenase nickel incorporation protein HypB [Sphingomonas sp.]|jgi:hydrogenase nickel incorporation protein HypB